LNISEHGHWGRRRAREEIENEKTVGLVARTIDSLERLEKRPLATVNSDCKRGRREILQRLRFALAQSE
jgi:hypothetical protein